MAHGDLYFIKNNMAIDAFDEYGISLEDEGISKIMTPAPHKEPVQNKNMAMHGTAIVGNVNLKDVRTLSLPMHIVAKTKEAFFTKYGKFCSEILDAGWIHLKTKYQPNVIYHFRYVDCQPFSIYNMEMAKFTLSLEEPNPNNRT
jgi:hypothetical protein